MKNLSGTMLGLAIGERSLLAAEISALGRGTTRRLQASHLAEFKYPEGISFDTPQALGEALKQFLRLEKFSTNLAVVGLPAKWLMVRPRQIPAVADELATDVMRLQAETEFGSEMDLVCDYDAGPKDRIEGATRSVLLMATPMRQLQAIETMGLAAGLKIRCITASAMALAHAKGAGSERQLVLWLDAHAGELSVQSNGHVMMLRHLRVEPASAGGTEGATGLEGLFGEIRRAVATAPSGAARELSLWDGIGLSAPQLEGLKAAVGMQVRPESLATLGITEGRQATDRRFAPAVLLAMGGMDAAAGIDFLHSRLSPSAPPRVKRTTVYIAIAAALVLMTGLWGYFDLKHKNDHLAEVQASITKISGDVKVAREVAKKVQYAGGYFNQQPRIDWCVVDLTTLFPPGEDTWATQLELKRPLDSDTISATLTVKTTRGQEQVLTDKLSATGNFLNVTHGSNLVGHSGKDLVMTVRFDYLRRQVLSAPLKKDASS